MSSEMKESSVPRPGAFLNDEEDSFLFSLRERSPSPPRIRTESVQPISPSNDREIDNDDDDGGAKYHDDDDDDDDDISTKEIVTTAS